MHIMYYVFYTNLSIDLYSKTIFRCFIILYIYICVCVYVSKVNLELIIRSQIIYKYIINGNSAYMHVCEWVCVCVCVWDRKIAEKEYCALKTPYIESGEHNTGTTSGECNEPIFTTRPQFSLFIHPTKSTCFIIRYIYIYYKEKLNVVT